MHKWIRTTFILIAMLVLLGACGGDAPTEVPPTDPPPTLPPAEPTSEVTLPDLEESQPTATLELPDLPSEPAESAPEISVPDTPLSSSGPWLVIVAGDGIWAANQDGSGMTHLLNTPLDDWFYSGAAVSADGGLVAFLNGSDRYSDLSLTIFSIPERRVLRTIPLTTEETEPAGGAGLTDAVEAVRAISDFGSFAFSPDSSMLGFMGVIEGDSSDLYVYDIAEDTITRITDGPSQGFHVYWSPDSEYIFHFGAETFGTGAGYLMDGAWAARADEGGVLSVYDPPEQGAEEFVGWLDDDTVIVNSWNPRCGSNNLRSVNIQDGDTQVLWADAFNDIFFDARTGLLAIASGIEGADCNPQERMGVYFVPLNGSQPRQILEGRTRYILQDELDSNIVAIDENDVPILILPDGRVVPLNAPPQNFGYVRPSISPNSQWIAWPSDQGWIGRQEATGSYTLESVLSERCWNAFWSRDSNTVFFITSQGLSIAYAPDFVSLQIMANASLNNASVFWMVP